MLKKKFLLVVSAVAISLSIFCTSKVNAALPEFKRIWGNDRYETCSKIVQEGWKSVSDYAVVVNGENFPDALSASVLAKKYNAPILLTEDNRLNTNTYNELKRLKVKKVFIVGGNSVIKPIVENSIHSMGVSTERFCGDDRNGTSAAVANEIGTENGIILTTDDDFSDALSIAPIAAKNQIPIILMSKDTIPSSIKNFMTGKNISKTYIIGGTNIISEDIALQFPKVQRIEGSDIYERNINIINAFQDKLNLNNVSVAYSEKFPDALSGSAFAALNGNPIILMGDSINLNTKYFLSTKINEIKNVTVLGGTAGIKDAQLQSMFNSNSSNNESNNSENPSIYESIEDNGSSAVKQRDWIYYSGNRQNSIKGDSQIISELYRVKNDSSRIEKLCNDFAQKIWIKDDWVYYINYKGLNKNNCLYRIKKDGKTREQITEDTPTYVVFDGEYIYYSEYINKNNSSNFAMYKIKSDGSEKQRIGDDHGIGLYKVGNWIYYENVDDNFKIYRMSIDGGDKKLICGDSAVNYMNVVGNWIYYCNNDDNNNLYRIKVDGGEKQKLNCDNSRNINIVGEYIYYSGMNENDIGVLYKIKTDGSEKKMLSDVDCSTSVEVKNGYVYGCGYHSKGVYKIKDDGTDYKNININESVISLHTVGDWIYYIRFNSTDMTNNLYKMKLDGSLDQRVE